MSAPLLVIVSAMTRDRVIGRGDGMPWDLPHEYRHFLELIRDDTVLMGRRSWEIFGGDLTSAHNVVVSRSASSVDGATVADSLERRDGYEYVRYRRARGHSIDRSRS